MNKNYLNATNGHANPYKRLADFTELVASERVNARLDNAVGTADGWADIVVTFKGTGARVLIKSNSSGYAVTKTLAKTDRMSEVALRNMIAEKVFQAFCELSALVVTQRNRFYHCMDHPRDKQTFNMLNQHDQALLIREWLNEKEEAA